jgi:hypothetical protein
VFQETDPLSFQQTDEHFGITQIPGVLRLRNDFNAYAIDSNEELGIYPTKLHLSKLEGKRKNMYDYLASAQQTKYAVTPLHTSNEFKLFHQALVAGGKFAISKGAPNFDHMATWWSAQADGKTIFYKLREHLANYYKIWSETRKATESMVASLPQRQKNHNRLHSAGHIAHVLPAAPHDQPGVTNPTPAVATEMPLSNETETPPSNDMLHISPEPLKAHSGCDQASNSVPGPSGSLGGEGQYWQVRVLNFFICVII